jgi:hypothetical protein
LGYLYEGLGEYSYIANAKVLMRSEEKKCYIQIRKFKCFKMDQNMAFNIV